MFTVTNFFITIFALGTLASCAYLALVIWVTRQFDNERRQARDRIASGRSADFAPNLTQIKPLRAVPNSVERECLKSFINQNYYKAKNQVILALDGHHDAAKWPEEERELLSLGDNTEISLGNVNSLNKKISVCVEAEKKAQGDIIILSDADMIAPTNLMSDIVDLSAKQDVGLVTCLYTVKCMRSYGSLLEGLSVNDFCASVLVARLVEGINFALGAVMAIKKETLQKIGGLAAIKDYLADDYQLGFRTAQSGQRVVLSREVVENVVGDMSFSEYFTHQLRWMRTYRVSRPGGFLSFFITQGLFWSSMLILTALISGSSVLGYAECLTGLWLFLRFFSSSYTWSVLAENKSEFFQVKYLIFSIVKDFIYILLWLAAFGGDKVEWGGKKYKVNPDGTLKLVD